MQWTTSFLEKHPRRMELPPLIWIFAGKPQLWCGGSDIKWTNRYIHFWAANRVFLLHITGHLYGFLKCYLSFSEGGAKHRGTARGVGGIMRRDQVTEEGSRIGFSVGRGTTIPGLWWAAAGMGCWGAQTHRTGWGPCSVRCSQTAVSQGGVVGHTEPADGALEVWHGESEQKPLGSCGDHTVVTGSVTKVMWGWKRRLGWGGRFLWQPSL